MNKYIAFFSISCTLLACSSPPQKDLTEFKYLIGKWEGNRDGMVLIENWKEEKPSSFSGEGIVFTGKDILFHEKLGLEIQDTTIVYTATTPNSKTPIPFKLISSGKNKWRFENKEQDFPQLITYTLINPDSLVATIEGIDKGKPSKEEFYFKKSN
jgi:hypothetical protein